MILNTPPQQKRALPYSMGTHCRAEIPSSHPVAKLVTKGWPDALCFGLTGSKVPTASVSWHTAMHDQIHSHLFVVMAAGRCSLSSCVFAGPGLL